MYNIMKLDKNVLNNNNLFLPVIVSKVPKAITMPPIKYIINCNNV